MAAPTLPAETEGSRAAGNGAAATTSTPIPTEPTTKAAPGTTQGPSGPSVTPIILAAIGTVVIVVLLGVALIAALRRR